MREKQLPVKKKTRNVYESTIYLNPEVVFDWNDKGMTFIIVNCQTSKSDTKIDTIPHPARNRSAPSCVQYDVTSGSQRSQKAVLFSALLYASRKVI